MKKKDKKGQGRKTTKLYDPVNIPLEEQYWDDWSDYRDSWRNPGIDKTLINKRKNNKQQNDKIKKKLFIRKKKKLLRN